MKHNMINSDISRRLESYNIQSKKFVKHNHNFRTTTENTDGKHYSKFGILKLIIKAIKV